MKPLIIDPEYLALIPRPTDEEYKALEASIVEYQRALEPIKINKDDIILDGHTRYDICSKHSLYFDTQVIDLPSILEEKIYVIESNLLRRNLNPFQRAELNLKLEPLLHEKGRVKQLSTLKQGNETPFLKDLKNGKDEKIINTAKTIATNSGMSVPTLYKVKNILEKGAKELVDKVRSGKATIEYANKVVNLADKHINTPPLPEGVFDVIYADPPWSYFNERRGNPSEHYETMSLDDISALKVPSADNSVLFLWVPGSQLVAGMRVMGEWGFSYLSQFVWVKDKIGLGYWVREQHELLLIGRKGDMSPPNEDSRVSSVLSYPRKEHSAKPPEVRNIIMKMLPNRKYLELFARGSPPEGWVFWGGEAN